MERSQTVLVNGIYFFIDQIISGVTQGTILGPLLFIIYNNYMLVSITTNYFLFAVDTKIFNEVFSKADTGDHQSDIDRLEE